MLRDSVSATPPAPTVTSNRTGRSGHFAADWAKAGAAAIANSDAKIDAKTEINCIMFLLQNVNFQN
jgi:hypothetical protein